MSWDPNMTTASEATIAQDNANINKVLWNKIKCLVRENILATMVYVL